MSFHRIAAPILALVASATLAAPALAAAPANDDFASAASLGLALSIGTSVNLTDASSEIFEQHPPDSSDASVWYSWTAPANGHVQVTACTPGGSIDDHATVYTGTTVASAWPVTLSGTALCGLGSSFEAKAGTTYHVQIEERYTKAHLGPTPVNLYEHIASTTTISVPATATSDANGSGSITAGGLVFFGFDWGKLSSKDGYCEIDGAQMAHVTSCGPASYTYSGLSVGTHTAKFATSDPWGFWTNLATTTITVPAPAPAGGPPPLVALIPPARDTPADPPTTTPVVTTPPTTTCPAKPAVKSVSKLSLRALRTRGARVTFAPHVGCPLKVTLSVAGRHGTLLTRTGSGTTVTLKPSRRALTRLHVHRGTRLTVTVAGTNPAHTSITVA